MGWRKTLAVCFVLIVAFASAALAQVDASGEWGAIWMDGRPRPSNLAPHTWAGFSTGRWERNTLVVETTHIKAGWLHRNGAPTSDLAT